MSTVIPECNVAYQIWDQDEGNYAAHWQPLNASLNGTDAMPEFSYRTAASLDSFPYWGLHGFYSGGGYVAELTGDFNALRDKIHKVRSNQWIDKYTRVILIELTIYNPNVNLFCISTIVAEVVDSGGIFTSYRFEPVNLLGYYSGAMLFQLVCEIIYLIFILFFIVKEIRNIIKQKKEYIFQFWNMIELSIIGISISGVVVYFYRMMITSELIEIFKETHGNGYMKFQYVGGWQELLMYMVAWLVFLATLKFLKLLRFNKKIGMMAATLRYGRKYLMAFGVMFGIMFFAFAQYFYMIYNIELLSFSTIIRSAETCMQMMLGRFNFYAMKVSQPVLGPMFFFIYTVVVAYILINMFLSILNESFAQVRADLAKQSNEYEMVEFILRRFQVWTGLGFKGPPPLSKNAAGGLKPAFPYEVNDFPEKVERLLNCISKVYFDQDQFEAIFDSSNPANKQMMKKMMKGGRAGTGPDPTTMAAMTVNARRGTRRNRMSEIDC